MGHQPGRIRPTGSLPCGVGTAPAGPAEAVTRSTTTRVLHGLILVSVLHQLIGSSFLSRPIPGEAPELGMTLHEYIGMGSLAVVALFWIWTVVRQHETSLGRLLPWFSRNGIGSVVADAGEHLGSLLRGRIPDDADGPLASAVHGLGLLTLTAMALTGTVYFFVTETPYARTILSLHKLMANLMWGYLIAHAGLAVLHQLLGRDMVSRMFWRRAPSSKS
jgi:cytochrome b561